MKRLLLLLLFALTCASCSELFETDEPKGFLTVRFSDSHLSVSGATAPLSGGAAPLSGATAPLSGGAASLSGATAPLSGGTAPLSGGAAPHAIRTGSSSFTKPAVLLSSALGTVTIPDIGEFILTLSDSEGEVIYNGSFADSPEFFEVEAGSYTVSAVSCEFNEPEYSAPQWGDTQVVCVASGSTVEAVLSCGQVNSGLKIGVSAEFRTLFPRASLCLESDEGSLMYSYGESRVAYFKPGKVRVSMTNDGEEMTLFTRNLAAREVLAITLTASQGGSGSGDSGSSGDSSGGDGSGSGSGGDSSGGGQGTSTVSVQIDTTRIWTEESIDFGDGDSGEILDVSTARDAGPMTDVWVYGYIVGAFSSSSHCEFEPPFTKNTNIVIGARTGVTDKTMCISVELKTGEIREILNLKDHPENRGKKVYLKGDLVEAYYGVTGLKNVSDYRLN